MINKKAQSIVEYTLLFGVIVGVIIFIIFKGVGGHSLEQKTKQAYDKAGDAMVNASDKLNEVFY